MLNRQVEPFFITRKVSDRRIVHVLHVLNVEPWLGPKHLAATVELSPSHLRHLFKQQMGTSITAFARELRLQLAGQLLRTTFRSLKQIRYDVGIPDASNFVRDFKRRFGMTPSVYRQSANSRFDQQIAV